MNKNIIKIIGLAAISCGVIVTNFCNSHNEIETNIKNVSNKATKLNNTNTKKVLSYVDVFDNYYNTLNLDAKRHIKKEEFIECYYKQNKFKINEYTDYANKNSKVYKNNNCQLMGSLADFDSDYVLSSNYFDVTPKSEFKRAPLYKGFIDYSSIKPGDIVFESTTAFSNCGHVALVGNPVQESYYGNYIQTMGAVEPVVSYGFLDDIRMVDHRVKILRVYNATDYEIDLAGYFVYNQLGKDYSLDLKRRNLDYSSKERYCSELIYAAYFFAGKDISSPSNIDVIGVRPWDIYHSSQVMELEEFLTTFLMIDCISVNNSTYSFVISNNSNENILLEYNERLAFFSDAKHCKNLKHLKYVNIAANSSLTLNVYSNFLADCAYFSRTLDGYRHISFCQIFNNSSNQVNYYFNLEQL